MRNLSPLQTLGIIVGGLAFAFTLYLYLFALAVCGASN